MHTLKFSISNCILHKNKYSNNSKIFILHYIISYYKHSQPVVDICSSCMYYNVIGTFSSQLSYNSVYIV